MIFLNDKIHVLDRDSVYDVDLDKLKEYMDISGLKIKSSCNQHLNISLLLENNVLIFLSYNMFTGDRHFSKCKIYGFLKLENMDPSFINSYHIWGTSKGGTTDGRGRDTRGPPKIILTLYEIKNNTVILSKIRIYPTNFTYEYKIKETKIVQFKNIIYMKQMMGYYLLYDGDNILVLNSELDILYTKHKSTTNFNHMIEHGYSYTHVGENIIAITSITNCDYLYFVSKHAKINKVLYADDKQVWILDWDNNVYMYEQHQHCYKKSNILLNTRGYDVVVHSENCYKIYIILNNKIIYLYNFKTRQINLTKPSYTTNISYFGYNRLKHDKWNKNIHPLFDTQNKDNIVLVMLCNKITNYVKICKPVLYTIFSLIYVL